MSRDNERKRSFNLEQWHLYVLIALVIAILFGVLSYLAPQDQYVISKVLGVFLWILNAVVWLITWVLVLFVPAFLGVMVFLGVNWLDGKFGWSGEDVPAAVHWLIACILAFGLLFVWLYVPAWMTGLPFWMQGWWWFGTPGPHENIQWGWGIWAAVTWILAYLAAYYINRDM